ncbi:hypothetical protein EDB83DRAFT_2314451 [Lactarius deliciosus]|nr:hypothetical protein EDB83DRAFT_2314451 [Lactarius deliciosus]
MVAVVVTWPSASSSCGRLMPLLHCGRVVVVPWSYRYRRTIVTPSSHHREESCDLHHWHTVCHVHCHVGLTSEWWWWLVVRVHVWEWRWWWASVGSVAVMVSPLHMGHPLYSRTTRRQAHNPPRYHALSLGPHTTQHPSSPHRHLRLHLAAHKPVAAASNSSLHTSLPPPPPPTARKRRHNATPTRRAIRRYDTDNDGNQVDDDNVAEGNSDAAAVTTWRRERWQRGQQRALNSQVPVVASSASQRKPVVTLHRAFFL